MGKFRDVSRLGAGLALFTLVHGLVNLPYSPGITTDEGWVLQAPHNLLHHGLYGTWDADGPVPFDPHVTTGPAVLLPVWGGFLLFGEGLMQARAVTVIYSALAVLAFYAVLRLTVDGATAALAALVLSLALYPHNRTVVGEMAGLFWMLLGGWLWGRGLESGRHTQHLLAGLCFGAAGLAKLALAPLAGAALALSWGIAALASRPSSPSRASGTVLREPQDGASGNATPDGTFLVALERNGQGSPGPSVGALILPLLVSSLLVLAWFGFQGAVLGWEALRARFFEMAGYQPQLLAPAADRLAQNALVLLLVLPGGLLPWWPVALLLTPFLLRGRLWKEPRYSFWAILFACSSLFYLTSLGWPRYGFWAVSLGVIFLAWVLSPLVRALDLWQGISLGGGGQAPALRNLSPLVRVLGTSPRWSFAAGAALAAALLGAPALGTWHATFRSDDSAERVALFLTEQVGAPGTVGSTEWDIDFLTGWRLKHPPRYTLPVSQQQLDASFDWSWPGMKWVVTGAAGEAFGAGRRLEASPNWLPRYSAGQYRVFQRAA